jgi:hypothetical protein
MGRFAHVVVLAAFLAVGIGASVTFAGEPAPAEQKDKKDQTSGKAEDDSKKDEKKMGGKAEDEGKKDEKKMGGK